MRKVIKWTNKYSNETGYVRVIRKSLKYFENTFDVRLARKFKSDIEINDAIQTLNYIGEGENNIFSIEEVQ